MAIRLLSRAIVIVSVSFLEKLRWRIYSLVLLRLLFRSLRISASKGFPILPLKILAHYPDRQSEYSKVFAHTSREPPDSRGDLNLG